MSRLNLYSTRIYNAINHTFVWFDLENNSSFDRRTMLDVENFVNQFDTNVLLCFGPMSNIRLTRPFFKWLYNLKFISMHIQTCDRLSVTFQRHSSDLRYIDLRSSDTFHACNCDAVVHMTNDFKVRLKHSKSLIV